MAKELNDTRRFWTVRNRLILGYGIEILITVLLGGYALTRLVVIKGDAHRLSRESLSGLSLIHQVDSEASKVFGLIHRAIVEPDSSSGGDGRQNRLIRSLGDHHHRTIRSRRWPKSLCKNGGITRRKGVCDDHAFS